MPTTTTATRRDTTGQPVEVITIGEAMALLDPIENGPPKLDSQYRLSFVGAESNVAIGLQRLGVHAEWISRLGADMFGDLIIEVMRAEGIDVHRCHRDRNANTGTMIKTRLDRQTPRLYYRSSSAATHLTPFDLNPGPARWLHVTGITTGLARSCRDTVRSAVTQAATAGMTISFDLNYRPLLWPSPTHARDAAKEILPHADWLLCGLDEAQLLFGGAAPADVAVQLRDAGPRTMVIRDGAAGAYFADGKQIELVPIPRHVDDVVDEVGAGDAFDTGFVFGQLRGHGVVESIMLGHQLAAHALSGSGDWETLPLLADLASIQQRSTPTTHGEPS